MRLPERLGLPSPARRRGRPRRDASRLQIEPLEARSLLSGMSLVGNWHDHDHLYSDLWGQRITDGPHAGDYAYLGSFASQGGIDIIDISDPAHPTLASTFLGTGGDNELVDVQVEDDIGYFASNTAVTGGIFIADVSNPSAPVQLARIDPSNGGFHRVHTLFVDGPYLYEVHPMNTFPEIRVFDVSDPAHPTFVRSIPSPSGEGIHEVTVRDGRLFTANFHSGGHVDIFDVSQVGDLSRPVPLLGTFHSGSATHTALSTEDGRFVVVTHEFAGMPLEIYDISDPARPTLASTIRVPRSQAFSAHQPAIVGDLLYVSWYEAGVRVYDIADPYEPLLVGSYDTYTGPYNEDCECAGLEGGAHGVNSDVEPGFGPLPCGAWGVYPFLGNDRILVSDFDGGLFIVSLDDPSAATTGFTAASIPGEDASPRGRSTDAGPTWLPPDVLIASPVADDPSPWGAISRLNLRRKRR